MDNVLTGIELIKHYQKDLSNSPGVYRMIDSNHKTLYVGKAKNLKKRVSSYTNYSGHSLRIQQMIFATSSALTPSWIHSAKAACERHSAASRRSWTSSKLW